MKIVDADGGRPGPSGRRRRHSRAARRFPGAGGRGHGGARRRWGLGAAGSPCTKRDFGVVLRRSWPGRRVGRPATREGVGIPGPSWSFATTPVVRHDTAETKRGMDETASQWRRSSELERQGLQARTGAWRSENYKYLRMSGARTRRQEPQARRQRRWRTGVQLRRDASTTRNPHASAFLRPFPHTLELKSTRRPGGALDQGWRKAHWVRSEDAGNNVNLVSFKDLTCYRWTTVNRWMNP